jgi:hypothetical protein
LWKKYFFLKKELIAAVPTDANSSENVTSIYKIATVTTAAKISKTDAKSTKKHEKCLLIATVHNRRKK